MFGTLFTQKIIMLVQITVIQFPKLCGMTGTAATESTEFESIYKLKVTIVPTNKPMIRKVQAEHITYLPCQICFLSLTFGWGRKSCSGRYDINCLLFQDESDVVFRAANGKWQAVVLEISRMNKTGRPVLVGTTSVEQSDALSEQLHEVGIPHEVGCMWTMKNNSQHGSIS